MIVVDSNILAYLYLPGAHTAAAEALLQTGAAPTPANLNKSELAAWTHVARVLINLHETITRE